MAMQERILIVDDDRRITAMLRRGLAFAGYRPLTANDGEEALSMVLQDEPDLVILDIMMPGLDGWEVCRRLRSGGSGIPVLMLTAKDEVQDRVKGLDLGADDYLVKPFALEELLARVRALLRRGKNQPRQEDRMAFEDLILDAGTREVLRGNRTVVLTTKEFDLLQLFMAHPKRVLTRDYIMEQIWGFDYSGESNVLDVYIALLRQKTEEGGEPRLIQTVRGTGYVLRSEH